MGAVAPAGDDVIVPLPQGLSAKMGEMVGAFRELEMKGHLPQKGEKLPALAASGFGIHDDFDLPGDLSQQGTPFPVGAETPAFGPSFSYQIIVSLTRLFNLKKKIGWGTV
jgi:hypothetical protein